MKFKDTVFHIQTEDRGLKAARIDTIIYKSGGAIVHRKQVFYRDILNCECLGKAIQELMSEIHTRTTQEIRKGLWSREGATPPDTSLRDILSKYIIQPETATGLR
ncbi:hypothetical protein JXA40_08865 [bacterium]|nr:hypothetical protein [candidate division CSSED10-310 bacterium]